MRPLLDEIGKTILKSRIYLSKETKLFKLRGENGLANGWGMSETTLHRYSNDAYREDQRVGAQKREERERSRDKSKCQLCVAPLRGHRRCPSCTMLYHGTKECGCIVSI